MDNSVLWVKTWLREHRASTLPLLSICSLVMDVSLLGLGIRFALLMVSVSVDPSAPSFTHFTQMVWKNTTQLGCGVAVCGNGQIFPEQYGPALYHVCLYDPVGNVIGEEQYVSRFL